MKDLSYIKSAIGADDLAVQFARASAVMVLTYYSRNITISASEWFISLNILLLVRKCVFASKQLRPCSDDIFPEHELIGTMVQTPSLFFS